MGRRAKEERASICKDGVTSTDDSGSSSEEDSDVSSRVEQEEESSSDEDKYFLGDQDSSTEVRLLKVCVVCCDIGDEFVARLWWTLGERTRWRCQ